MDVIREELLREIEDNVLGNEDCDVICLLLSINKEGNFQIDVCTGDETSAKFAFLDAYIQLMQFLGQVAKVSTRKIKVSKGEDGVYYVNATVRPDGIIEQ